MNNILRIKRKMEKVYKRPIDNIYSHSFYSELFSGYEYSLSEEKINRRDFYIIIPDDKEIVELFGNGRHYDFSYEFSQSIDRVLYSMAVYGKAYIFVKPDYINESDANGKEIKKLSAIHIGEVKGIPKKGKFYSKTYSNGISEFNIEEGKLIIFDLKEFGYKRNYFKNLVKHLGKYDITSNSLELINTEHAYDFSVHADKNRKRFLKKVRNIGWSFGTDGLSDSYILYKEIQMKLFKMQMLQNVLMKINQVIATEYIPNKEFEIKALTSNVDYVGAWTKFQSGELTVSELNNIVWKGLTD